MRFSIITFVLLLTVSAFVRAETAIDYLPNHLLTSENIEKELARRTTFMRRAEEEGDDEGSETHASGSGNGSSSSSETDDGSGSSESTSSEKQSSSPSSDEHGSSSSESSSKQSTSKSGHGGGKSSSFISPAILQGGTLFYIAVGVTTFLWITGKAIDVQMNRQERYAEKMASSI